MEGNLHNAAVLVFTGIGATVLWAKVGLEDLAVYGLGEVWRVLGLEGRAAEVLQLIAFVLIGIGVSFGFVHPQTVAQGFTAGLGWTSLLTSRRDSKSNGAKASKRR